MNYEALDAAIEYLNEGLFPKKQWSPNAEKRLEEVCKFIEKMYEKHRSMLEGYTSETMINLSFGQPHDPEKIRKKVFNSFNGYKFFVIGGYSSKSYANELAKYAHSLPLIKKYPYRITIVANTTSYTFNGIGGGTTTYTLKFMLRNDVE